MGHSSVYWAEKSPRRAGQEEDRAGDTLDLPGAGQEGSFCTLMTLGSVRDSQGRPRLVVLTQEHPRRPGEAQPGKESPPSGSLRPLLQVGRGGMERRQGSSGPEEATALLGQPLSHSLRQGEVNGQHGGFSEPHSLDSNPDSHPGAV